MKRTPLSPRPRVPVLVRATTLGTLALAPALGLVAPGCGDDGSNGSTSNDSDVHPTAGPCAHDPGLPECGTTMPLTSGTTASTATSTSDATNSSTAADGDTDIHPTAGPCAHDPMLPECATTGDSGTTGDTDTETGTGSGTAGSGTTAG